MDPGVPAASRFGLEFVDDAAGEPAAAVGAVGPDPLEFGGFAVEALERPAGDGVAVLHEQQQATFRRREPFHGVFTEFEADVVENAVITRRIFAREVGGQWPDPRIRRGDPDGFGHGSTCSGKRGTGKR